MSPSVVPHLRESINFFTLGGEAINRSQGGRDDVTRLLGVISSNPQYFCSGINPVYVVGQVKYSDILLVSYEPDKKRRIIGFAALKIMGPGHIYIPIICSNSNYRGVGSMMLDRIKIFASLMHGHDGYLMDFPAYKITLNSVPDMVGFYKKQGFEQNTPIDEDDEDDEDNDGVHMTYRNILTPAKIIRN
jgi:hypothetical protein